MKTAMIISHRDSGKYRERNLEFVLKYYKGIFDKTILVFQETEDDRRQYPGCEQVFAYNPGAFNRSWGFNVGAVRATGCDTFYFCDSDIIVEKFALCDAMKLLEQKTYQVINPYSSLCHLTEAVSEQVVKDGLDWRAGYPVTSPSPSFAGGSVFVSRSVFEIVNGWEERIRGWGGEDNLFAHVLVDQCGESLTSIQHSRAAHLFHCNGSGQLKRHHKHYEANLEITREVGRIGVDAYLENKRKEKIGEVEKYINEK